MTNVWLKFDDIDRHSEGCNCGLCNRNGKSYGISITEVPTFAEVQEKYMMLGVVLTDDEYYEYLGDNCDDPIEVVYAPSEEAANHNAELICKNKGYIVVA